MAEARTALPAAAPVLKAAGTQTSTTLRRCEDYVLPQTVDIVRAVRHLAAG